MNPKFAAKHLPQLDGLRGCAIGLVLVWHYCSYFSGDSLAERIVRSSIGLAWSGVDLFFVLSGFLIGGIVIDNRLSPNFFSVFYLRRSCRILPLYAVILGAFVLLIACAVAPWLTAGAFPVFTYFTFTQNVAAGWYERFGADILAVTWSLAVEEQFYLLLPIVVRFCSPRRLPWMLLALAALAPLSRIVVYHWFSSHHLYAAYTLTICRADALLLGVICAWIVRSDSLWSSLKHHRRTVKLVVVGLAGGMVWLGAFSPAYYSKPMVFVGLTWIAMFYALVVLLVLLEPDHLFARAIIFRPLRNLGKVAYGAYLLHVPIAILLHHLTTGTKPNNDSALGAMTTALSLVVTIVLARLSFRYFENPITQYGHQFKYTHNERAEFSYLTTSGALTPIDVGSTKLLK